MAVGGQPARAAGPGISPRGSEPPGPAPGLTATRCGASPATHRGWPPARCPPPPGRREPSADDVPALPPSPPRLDRRLRPGVTWGADDRSSRGRQRHDPRPGRSGPTCPRAAGAGPAHPNGSRARCRRSDLWSPPWCSPPPRRRRTPGVPPHWVRPASPRAFDDASVPGRGHAGGGRQLTGVADLPGRDRTQVVDPGGPDRLQGAAGPAPAREALEWRRRKAPPDGGHDRSPRTPPRHTTLRQVGVNRRRGSMGLMRPTSLPAGSRTTAVRAPKNASYGSWRPVWPAAVSSW